MTVKRHPLPPFTVETAKEKVQLVENAWNTKDAEKVSKAYTIDTEWRNRNTFLNGRKEVIEFKSAALQPLLTRLWLTENTFLPSIFSGQSHRSSGSFNLRSVFDPLFLFGWL
jgi:nuclear transport factor 2 (NTF2) superfamily protein